MNDQFDGTFSGPLDPTDDEAEATVAGLASVTSRRMLIRSGLALAIGLIGLVFVLGLATLLADVSKKGETNDVFTEAAELPPTLIDAVSWLPDGEDTPRQMEPLTRSDVAATWLRAWAQIAILAETGETTGLEIYFSNSALEGMEAAVDDWKDRPVHQISHELQLSFYSEDGQVVGLTATRTRLLRTEVIGGQKEYFDVEESYEAILILEDGNWRVQHWVRRSATGSWPVASLTPGSDEVGEGFVGPSIALFQIEQSRQASNLENNSLRDVSILEAQLDTARDAGATAVRVSLDSPTFASEDVTDDDLAWLESFLELAQRRELSVIATLFDQTAQRPPSSWNADILRLERLIPVLTGRESVMVYELAHQPDLLVSGRSENGLVDAWLGHIGRAVRELDGATPIMITWSDQDAAIDARLSGDIVGFIQPQAASPDSDIVGQMDTDGVKQILVRSTAAVSDLPRSSEPLLGSHLLVKVLVLAVLAGGLWFLVRFFKSAVTRKSPDDTTTRR